MTKKTIITCPNCGASMRFSPSKEALVCKNCQFKQDIDSNFIVTKKPIDFTKIQMSAEEIFGKESVNLHCPNCGANIISNELEFSGICPYCDTALANSKGKTFTPPDSIIPFKFDKDVAAKLFKEKMRKKLFAPTNFKKHLPLDKIKALYIPCFLFDAQTETSYRATIEIDEEYTDARGQRRTHTRYEHVSGKINLSHNNVLVEASSHINQKDINSIENYDFSQLRKFKKEFILGYTVEQNDNSVENCKKIAQNMINNRISNAISRKYSYGRVTRLQMDTTYFNEGMSFSILPTYMADYTFKEKKYRTMMNGQTGKIGGKYPKSGWKITTFILSIIGGIGLIILLIALLAK